MRWSCPHCGTHLAVADDKVGSGWSFSRCYKCAGFALVRRAELSIIKVDRAPAGERVLLPESTEDPTASLSRAAAQNLAQIAPKIVPAKPRAGATPPAATSAAPTPAPIEIPSPENALPAPILEEVGDTATRNGWFKGSPLLHGAIGAVGMLALGSGFYLYNEAQSVLRAAQKVSQPAPVAAVAQAEKPVSDVVDEVRHQAMAPAPAPPQVPVPVDEASPPTKELLVKARGEGAKLYGGPGVQYPVIANADPSIRYVVADWSDRWFKVAIPDAAAGTHAWIRNDQVRLVPPVEAR